MPSITRIRIHTHKQKKCVTPQPSSPHECISADTNHFIQATIKSRKRGTSSRSSRSIDADSAGKRQKKLCGDDPNVVVHEYWEQVQVFAKNGQDHLEMQRMYPPHQTTTATTTTSTAVGTDSSDEIDGDNSTDRILIARKSPHVAISRNTYRPKGKLTHQDQVDCVRKIRSSYRSAVKVHVNHLRTLGCQTNIDPSNFEETNPCLFYEERKRYWDAYTIPERPHVNRIPSFSSSSSLAIGTEQLTLEQFYTSYVGLQYSEQEEAFLNTCNA